MCVLYVSFGSNVRPRTFGCVTMGSALLFIVRSRLLVYSAGSAECKLICLDLVRVFFPGMYFLAALMLVCVDVMIMSSAYAMT